MLLFPLDPGQPEINLIPALNVDVFLLPAFIFKTSLDAKKFPVAVTDRPTVGDSDVRKPANE
jgi:hypothetical protein